MSPDAPISTALIGLGGISKAHLNALEGMNRFRLDAVCDTRNEALAPWRKQGAVRTFTDPDELMRVMAPDLVIVATPDASHAGLTLSLAAFQPRAILCEKPMAVHYADAVEMVRVCAERGILLLINHQRRISAGKAIRDAIERGEIGDLVELEARCPGDLIGDGTHAIDTLLSITGRPPVGPVWGMVDHGESSGTLRYGRPKERAAAAIWFDEKNVRYAVHTGACVNRSPYQSYRIRGTRGELWHPGGVTQPAVYLNDGQPGSHRADWDEHGWYLLPTPQKGGPWRHVASGELDPMRSSLDLLARRLDGALEDHPLEGHHALVSHSILSAAYLAAHQGSATPLPLPTDTRFPRL